MVVCFCQKHITNFILLHLVDSFEYHRQPPPHSCVEQKRVNSEKKENSRSHQNWKLLLGIQRWQNMLRSHCSLNCRCCVKYFMGWRKKTVLMNSPICRYAVFVLNLLQSKEGTIYIDFSSSREISVWYYVLFLEIRSLEFNLLTQGFNETTSTTEKLEFARSYFTFSGLFPKCIDWNVYESKW